MKRRTTFIIIMSIATLFAIGIAIVDRGFSKDSLLCIPVGLAFCLLIFVIDKRISSWVKSNRK